jgi:hypothetical protein
MIERRLPLLVVVTCGLAVCLVTASSTRAAYPPGGGTRPTAKCSISTIVNRRVAVSCNAGKRLAGRRCSLKIRASIVARGKVGKDGRYAARFTVPRLLTRGTKILFLVDGKTAATMRV